MKYRKLSRLYKYFFYLNSKKSKIVYTREKFNENHKFLDFKKKSNARSRKGFVSIS